VKGFLKRDRAKMIDVDEQQEAASSTWSV
jgi:hypothetical protein